MLPSVHYFQHKENFREKKLMSLFLSGTNLGEPALDPLFVLHLDNRLYIEYLVEGRVALALVLDKSPTVQGGPI